MRVSVVTPDTSFYDGEAVSVNLMAIDGRFGILTGHAPLIARLGHGVAEVNDGTTTHRVAVYGGFIKVQDDIVSVLAGGAAKKTGDVQAAREAHEEALAALEKAKAAEGPVPLDVEEALRRARAFLDLFEV